jgi:Zn-dependent peptidase ImmA (M78 family)/O-acetyl-ADP-ribose deacetylase (regulator of RNase III)
MSSIEWTNSSVKQLAGNLDPIHVITEKTRALVLDAIDEGWYGPPFRPFTLAERLGFSVVPKENIRDARVVTRKGRVEIEYNPHRPRRRIRFSIAHEIAHTLFPDFTESIHNRSVESPLQDEWQLELLCNISAAEILMPIGPSFDQEKFSLTLNKVIAIRDEFEVSTEAALLRLGKLTLNPITIFASSKVKDEKNADYRIDYSFNSPTSSVNLISGMRISSKSILSECIAIGFTAKGKEKWLPDLPEFDIECVGVAPYPNNIYPRVLGLIKTKKKAELEIPTIRYLRGDATNPRGDGHKIIAQIANDESYRWGRGFGSVLSKKWPEIRHGFRDWINDNEDNLELGNSYLHHVSEDLSIFSMIAQRGFGSSRTPRIRYQALKQCLKTLLDTARELSATVHMPRIGTGYAGGNWNVISELIEEVLTNQGIEVSVYDLPDRDKPKIKQNLLDFTNRFIT